MKWRWIRFPVGYLIGAYLSTYLCYANDNGISGLRSQASDNTIITALVPLIWPPIRVLRIVFLDTDGMTKA